MSERLANHKVVVWLSIVASVLGILVFVTGKASLPDFIQPNNTTAKKEMDTVLPNQIKRFWLEEAEQEIDFCDVKPRDGDHGVFIYLWDDIALMCFMDVFWSQYFVGNYTNYEDGVMLDFKTSFEIYSDEEPGAPLKLKKHKENKKLAFEKIDCESEVTHFCIYREEFNAALIEEYVSPVSMHMIIEDNGAFAKLIWNEIAKFKSKI